MRIFASNIINIMARKRKELPVLENIEITDVAAEGKSLARIDNMVLFVPYAVPGDVVDVRVTRKKHHFMEGTVLRFHKMSEHRQKPVCPHYGVCGGCKWQCLTYEQQIYWKQRQVMDNLTRIGKIELPECSPILGSAQTEEYRNKVGVYEGAGYLSKGMYRPMQNCLMNSFRGVESFCPVCQKNIEHYVNWLCE